MRVRNRRDEDENPDHSNPARLFKKQDDAFQIAMVAAIEAGLEQAPAGVETTPSTERPIRMQPAPAIVLRSNFD